MMKNTEKESNRGKQIGLFCGYFFIVLFGLAITGLSLSIWAKPYTSAKDTVKAITSIVRDTTKTVVVTNNLKSAIEESKQVDTLAINAAFLQRMREKGELLSSDEFASRISDYYNTLVAVLAALFVLFTLVTYTTIRSKFEVKFEDKARDIEKSQRKMIEESLLNLLNDSKKIDEVIQTAIGGRIDDSIATKEELDDLSDVVATDSKIISTLLSEVTAIKKNQKELFEVVAEMQDDVAEGATVHQENDIAEEPDQEQEEETEE